MRMGDVVAFVEVRGRVVLSRSRAGVISSHRLPVGWGDLNRYYKHICFFPRPTGIAKKPKFVVP